VVELIGALMQSPRWHWDVTVLRDQFPPDPQHPFVSERAGRPTIGMPIAMLRELWTWVLTDIDERASVLRWLTPTIDPALWQKLRTHRPAYAPPLTKWEWYRLYGYLSPLRFPDIAEETYQLLHAPSSYDRYSALTVLTRWLESSDHATRTVAAQMLHGWPHVVAALVRSHPLDGETHTMLDRLVPTILTATRPEDRVAWVTTLWDLVTDPTLSDERRQMSANALKRMLIHDPMVAALLRALLWARLSPQRIMAEPVWDPLLATLIRTVCADEVLMMIEQTLATIRATMETDCDPIVRRFDRILAAGWGNGHDHRILQIIDSLPGPHWQTALTEGVTASVGEVVCDRLLSWFPRTRAGTMIVDHIHAREERGDWPLAPMPVYLVRWVSAAARSRPSRLHPTTIRRLWLDDPDYAWNVTCTMLGSPSAAVRTIALAALDAGWGTKYDDTIATIVRMITLQYRMSDILNTACATAVAGIGRVTPDIIASLLTDLATMRDTEVQRQLIRALHRGWGRGQDDLVMRVLETMVARDPDLSDRIWIRSYDTLARAWDYHPPHVVVSLVDRMVTHGMRCVMHEQGIPSALDDAIAAYAPGWTHLPTAHMIERIARHVAYLCAHADDPAISRDSRRERLISAWASVIAAGAERLSTSDIHALLSPLWDLSPDGCLKGIEQWVRR
jgi:hypothetical protein